jgi:lysozyme
VTIDPRLIKDVETAEGCELTAYQDTLGNWTVGYGHKLPAGRSWSGYTIQPLTATYTLEGDLQSATQYAQSLAEWTRLDTPCRQNALIELCFNMRTRWLTFVNTRNALQLQNWQAAHDGLLASEWASQVGPARSTRIANYFLTGQYP